MEKVEHDVYGYVDVEGIPLCDAINAMPGLKTTYSCCGHGRQGFLVFVKPESPEKLGALLYGARKAIGWREMPPWKMEVVTRSGQDVGFMLHSQSVGDVAYEESRVIADVLLKSLADVGSDPEFDLKWNNTFF